MRRKVVLIGIDGADWHILNKWIDEGKLPNFKKLKENGIFKRISTVIPPMTAPAWTSIFTGSDPSEHGVFGMVKFDIFRKKLNIYTLCDIKVDPIWRILDRRELRSIIIRFPLAYPVEKINGIMIGGLFAPILDKKSVYPPSLLALIKDFPHETSYNKGLLLRIQGKYLDVVKYYNDIFRKRVEVVKYLHRNYKWDFFFALFDESDRLLHLFADKEDYVLPHFKEIDNFVGWLIDNMDEDTSLVIMSDHGFRKINKVFFINDWLIEEGYLNIPVNKKIKEKVTNTILRILAKIPNFYTKYLANNLNVKVFKHMSTENPEQLIEYLVSNSIATCLSYGEGGIRLNPYLDPNERKYYKKDIISKLNKLRDPDTGERILYAYDRDSIYKGMYRYRGPDILLLPFNGYTITSRISASSFIAPSTSLNKWGDHLNVEAKENAILFVYNYEGASKEMPSSVIQIQQLILSIMELT